MHILLLGLLLVWVALTAIGVGWEIERRTRAEWLKRRRQYGAATIENNLETPYSSVSASLGSPELGGADGPSAEAPAAAAAAAAGLAAAAAAAAAGPAAAT